MKPKQLDQDRYYAGVPWVAYDLVKELVLATVAIGVIALVLSFGLSSPDYPSVTIKSWATADPVDFVTTATAELAGTSDSALYGPPYTNGSDSVQAIGPFAPQQWAGNAMHLDTAQEFVLGPLTTISAGDSALSNAISTYKSAGSDQQQAWLSAYTDALGSATVQNGAVAVAEGDYGPVQTLMQKLLIMAQSGSLDGVLLSSPGAFFQTNYSAPLLFMGDGSYVAGLAEQQNLQGDQWGVMNETGSYPGQTWLWLFSMWYQVPPFNTAANADILVVLTVGILTLLLALIPYIPILRDIPRWIPIHRLIWRHSGSPANG
ncbi:MAG: hypothetical protein ABSB75_03180 [Candidatus Limnocylindrales bacterium]